MKSAIKNIVVFILIVDIFPYFAINISAQTQKLEFGGYVTEMPAFIRQNLPESQWWTENLVHNRLNFGWQINDFWRFDAGLRTRLATGSETIVIPESMDFDKGRIDASWNVINAKSGNYRSLLNLSADRFFVTFEKSKLKLQLGRQRINWGQTLVWNPNDIFNTYSFFDFDYPERSGCDAFRATYFHTETASTELAASVNYQGKTTAALMHHRNWRNIDFQVLAGIFEDDDFVFGGACSGDLSGLNFRGEFSYFQQMKNNSAWKLPPPMAFAASFGLDYIFSNSLMLQAEVLYNDGEPADSENGIMGLYEAPLSAKQLSVSKYNLFAQASYPLTARLNGAVSGIWFADLDAVYSGISLDYSMLENLDLSLIMQFFTASEANLPENMQALLGFVRLKYSF
ncbi:MAG: hypothetical protein LBR64_07660 [Dysgonamonadaceae bacterium]|jgi:hypothetical protein|nr:hypothetical protein [Dysgonamonadaceae bacterium]